MYLPRHDTQYEPRTKASPYDCNMAAAADALRFYTLALKDRNHDQLRHDSGTYWEVVDNNPDNNGTNISDAQHALSVNGCPSAAYDWQDGKSWDDVLAALVRGSVVIAHGDYGSVPAALRGPISRTFTGNHSVLFAQRTTTGVKVGDGLNDAWVTWPYDVARRYMVDFPGGPLTYLTVTPRKLAAKVPVANVRADHTTASRKLGTISPRSRIHVGGTVIGQSVGGNRTWYRVWYASKIAYVHSSVGKIV